MIEWCRGTEPGTYQYLKDIEFEEIQDSEKEIVDYYRKKEKSYV